MDRNAWFSRRALKLHAVILVLVPAFMALCIWQIRRATGGNELSWAYVFEWPFFAAYAIYMWWRLLHAAPEGDPPSATLSAPSGGRNDGEQGRTDGTAPSSRVGTATRTPDGPEAPDDDPELVAYNRYLADLAEQDRARGR